MTESRYIIRLNQADMITLSGVLSASLAVVCALQGKPYLATSLLFLAMLGDALDGMLARKLKLERSFGRYLDGFMDVLIYLVAPSLTWYLWGFDSAGALSLLVLIGCGCVRLSVFNDIGNIQESNGLAYLGMPVFWSVFMLGGYGLLALMLSAAWLHGLLVIALLAFSHAMLLRRPFFKFKKLSHILGLTLGGATLFLMLHLLVNDAGPAPLLLTGSLSHAG